jgi:hypothetical protein
MIRLRAKRAPTAAEATPDPEPCITPYPRHPYWDRKTQPIDPDVWSRPQSVGDPAYGPTQDRYRVLARTRVKDGGIYESYFIIETTWHGVHVPLYGRGRNGPLIFRTAVTKESGDW